MKRFAIGLFARGAMLCSWRGNGWELMILRNGTEWECLA